MASPSASPSSSLRAAAFVAIAIAAAACHRATPAETAAGPILEKNAAARGGLAAWQKVKAMSLSGTLEAGRPRDPVKLAMSYLHPKGPQAKGERRAPNVAIPEVEKAVELPFAMELKRPLKQRLEIKFQGQTAVQAFDGKQGWKLRPFLGRREVEPYTAEELRQAALQTELDGPLLEAAAKGHKVELLGTEKVEGADAYKLKVTLGNGQVRHVWVDAKTFLDVKIDGSRKLDGKLRPVFTWFRDYRSVGGLQIAHVLETTVEGVKGSEKIFVERVALNPELDDARFGKPL